MSVFVAWGRLSRRTVSLSRELGLELFFVRDKAPYMKSFLKTYRFLSRRRPDLVFVQLPQGPLLAEVVRLSRRHGFKVVADVHTGFIYPVTLKEVVLNKPFWKYLRETTLVLVHNKLEKKLVEKTLKTPSSKVVLVYDPLPRIPEELSKPRIEAEPGSYLILPSSWAPDEPLEFVVREFLKSRISRNHSLVLTGNWRRNLNLYKRIQEFVRSSNKIVLTGYLKDSEYYYLLKNAKAVIAATNREYTMLHALWEAIAARVLALIPKTKTLEAEISGGYPCFYTFQQDSLRECLDKCIDEYYPFVKTLFIGIAEKLATASDKSILNLRSLITTIER